jgi:peptidyl-prolyl cis-trans isomerase D
VLEAIRRNSRSTIIYVLFGVLIAVFVINFGPGQSGGCGGVLSTSFAARVAGSTVSEQDYRLSYIALGGPNIPAAFARERHLKEFVMDKLIERELLAAEAEKLGFSVSQKEVEDLLATGKMYILSIPRRADDFMVEGAFDYKRFQTFVENRLGVNVQRFLEVQQREMLAEKVKQLMGSSVKVTPAEAKADYEQRETTANLEFVRFSPRQFESKVDPSADEIAAYAKSHAAEIQKQYDERSFLYKKVERQAHLREVLVAVDKDEKDEAAVKKAEAKAAKLRAAVGKAGMAAVAKRDSDDAATRARGGDLGWRKKGLTGLGQALEDKVFAAKAGDIIGPERTDRGFEIVEVGGFREGDIPLEQVAPEIAEDKLRTESAKALAKAEAERAIQSHAADKTLAEEFPKPESEESDPVKRALQPPAAEETGAFPKRGELIPQLGVSSEVMKQAFTLKPGQVAGPFDVSGSWIAIRVKDRKDPDWKSFDEHKDEQLRQLERQKWADVVEEYTKQRCIEARDAGNIKWNDQVLSYEGVEGPAEVHYVPCGNRL